jgi:hypothetical protein
VQPGPGSADHGDYGAGFPVMAPPPLWGPPPPLRPGPGSDVGAVAGSWTLPGIGAVPVVGGDGFGMGAALTDPSPNVRVDNPRPAAIAAALAKRLRSIVVRSLRGYVVFSVLACGYPANAETNQRRRATMLPSD